jgi:putative tryptophan/tyrosine transport system substrate-binding protein
LDQWTDSAPARLGWSNGHNVRVDFRFAQADDTRLPSLAGELIDLNPDVVVALGSPAATALRLRSLSLPIVFVQIPDAVSAGFVTNLARPEGNITGFTNFEVSIGGKWLQLLKQCVPAITAAAVVFDPNNPTWGLYLRSIEAAAPTFGVKLTPVGVRDASEIDTRIGGFAREPNSALIVLPSPVTIQYRGAVIAAAAQQHLPAIYPYRFFAASGGLMAYGVDILETYKGAASYVDRILKGAKIAELPVQQPAKFNLVINLRTAKALGLAIPASIQSLADETIE